MTRDDIIRLAREAGFSEWAVGLSEMPAHLERFAALIAEHEREKLRQRLDQCEALAQAVMTDQISCDCKRGKNK